MAKAAKDASKQKTTASGKANGKRGIRLQYGALPYRVSVDRDLELLLVTTRQSGRWIIPKGSPIKGLTPSASAAQEAFEEAGVRGTVKARPIGRFNFEKSLVEKGIFVPCEVVVFSLCVARQYPSWPEQAQRIVRWFSPKEAIENLRDEGLIAVVRAFVNQQAATKPKPKKIHRTKI